MVLVLNIQKGISSLTALRRMTVSISSQIPPPGLSSRLGTWSNEEFSTINDRKPMVPHPMMSAHTMHYPDFDPFARQTLTDNGYMEDSKRFGQNLDTINY